jgi:AcrR family transcriptional regulator
MPRIVADSVAHNRDYRVSALMRAGAAQLAESGSFTVESVTTAVGISRSSFYEYFSSADDLTTAILDEEIAALAAELEPPETVTDPSIRIRSWVRIRLSQADDRGQRLLHSLAPERERDERLVAPLHAAIADAGVNDPERARDYIVALVNVGMRRIGNGICTAPEEATAIMKTLGALLED